MDIYELLKSDHERVRQSLALLENMPAVGEKAELKEEVFDYIMLELLAHSRAEEEVFYTPLRERGLNEMIHEAKDEHQNLSRLLSDINGMSVQDEDYPSRLALLKEALNTHVAREESEIFRQAQAIFSRDETRDMAAEMLAHKRKFMMMNPLATMSHKLKEAFEA